MPRVFRTAFERESLLSAFRASGLRPGLFAEREHIPLSTFYQWLTRAAPPKRGPRIVRVVRSVSALPKPARAEVAPMTIVLELGVARVRVETGFDRSLLAEVLDILEPRCQRPPP